MAYEVFISLLHYFSLLSIYLNFIYLRFEEGLRKA